MRLLARLVLLVAIGIQGGYEVVTYRNGLHGFGWWYAAAVTICFAALLAFDTRALAGLLRVALGVAFVLCGLAQWNVIERAGSATAILGQLVQSLGLTANPAALVPSSVAHALPPQMLAAAFTGAQLVVGFGLVGGLWRRFFSIVAALLAALSAAAVFVSSGLLAIVAHALPVLFGGALVLAAPRGEGTFARLFSKRRENDPFLFAFDEAQERASRYRASIRRSS
jgi:uncharacterized membrane protein YphA (DoxX/SURF4 family)